MSLHTKYLAKNRIKEITCPNLQSILKRIIKSHPQVYLLNLWSYPYTKKITLMVTDLELAFKLNIYDNITVTYVSETGVQKALKQEWIREYFVSQMPEFMVCDIITLIDSGESPESAWNYLVSMWLPDNQTAKQVLEFHSE